MSFYSTCTAWLILGLLAECGAAIPSHTSRSNSPISWGSCGSFDVNSTDPNFQCGYLEVPMDYHDSSAGSARLAVIKYVATAKKSGSILFNPGGPAASGLQILGSYGQRFSQVFHGTYDVVSWDSRGAGHTFPGEVYIFDNIAEDVAYWNNTVFTYINETISGRFDQKDVEELYSRAGSSEQKFKDFDDRCVNSPSGPYLKYLGTSSTVRDLVSLGDAIMGKDQPINYWGNSYGTIIGFNFLNMFPERAGHVILDGLADPITWVSSKYLSSTLVDIEKTYSGLTDGCAAAGRVGCKLIEFTGDNASGEEVKNLINDAHDVALELYRAGYQVPANPSFLKLWLYNNLINPVGWSGEVNGLLYEYVALALQAAQVHNIQIPEGRRYNIPVGKITTDATFNIPNRISYSPAAIIGADDFNDGNTRIKDFFDIIVENTRGLTPTFGTVWPVGSNSYGWSIRSVERLPPYSPKQLKNPVLVIGNTADPITPFANAKKVAGLLSGSAFLVEQLGLGHTSLAQVSSCTLGIIGNYVMSSKLPEGRTVQCPVDSPNLFPPLNKAMAI